MNETQRIRILRRKRVFDVLLVVPLLIISLPLMLIVALGVMLFVGRPVLFTQRRPGLGGQVFTLVKFRTMRDALGPDGQPLPDGQRLTAFGRLLRASSLDELPELLNVLRGDMSLVGPRPLLTEYLPLYSAEQARRHDMPPGITGWAQVNGRNALSWEEKFQHDVWYVDHVSLWLDIRIIGRTILTVLRRRGINAKGSDTAEKFAGTRS